MSIDGRPNLEPQLTVETYKLLVGALQAVGTGVVIRDVTGAEVFRNSVAQVLQYSNIDLRQIERSTADLMDGALRGNSEELQLRLVGPPRRALELSSSPIFASDDSEEVVGAVVVIDDVSARHRVDKVRRDFVANISHELKTPVGAMSLLAETLANEQSPEVIARLVERIQVEAQRVTAMVDDLLNLAQVEAQDQVPDEPVRIADVVDDAAARVQTQAERRSMTINVNCDGSLYLRGDKRQLITAVHNLLENALKYSDDGGTVSVDVTADDRSVSISVKDDGVGIPEQDLERVFERFYRVDRARARETGGTGLGLAIVRHIANNHGGTVHVSSSEGKGTVFTLRFPNFATDQEIGEEEDNG